MGIARTTVQIGAHLADHFTLTNAHGMQVELTNWGASLVDVRTADRHGVIESVTLAHREIGRRMRRMHHFLAAPSVEWRGASRMDDFISMGWIISCPCRRNTAAIIYMAAHRPCGRSSGRSSRAVRKPWCFRMSARMVRMVIPPS